MTACERLPEQHADGPDVRGRRRGVAPEPFRRDVRERSRNVAGRGQRLRLRQARKAEVQQADRSVLGREQNVRRLDVAVDDAAYMCVREPLEHLRRGFDRRLVVEVAGA